MLKTNFFLHQLYCLDEAHRNKGIEGLRAIAVLMVFNTHALSYFYFSNFFVVNNPFLLAFFKFTQSGHYGVDVFFVISGYLICKTTIGNNFTFLQYFHRRFIRLMPAHVAVLLLVAPSGFLLFNFIGNILFFPSFIKSIPNFNFVTWSLGWEWLFYVCFFILYKILRISSKRYFNLGIFIFILLLLLLTAPDLPLSIKLKGNFDIPIPGRFFGFFIGVYAAQASVYLQNYRSQKFILLTTTFGAIGFICWIWVYSVYRETPEFNSYVNLNMYFIFLDLLVGMIILGLVSPVKSGVKKFLSLIPLRILGQISYSFYLIHASIGIPLAMQLIKVHDFESMCFFYVVSFIFCFLISSVLFIFFERPIIKRLKNISIRHEKYL